MTLDDALAAWAATVRLSDADAAEIYRRIVATPVPPAVPVPVPAPAPAAVPAGGGPAVAAGGAGLDPAWWRAFSAEFTAGLVGSTRPTRWAA